MDPPSRQPIPTAIAITVRLLVRLGLDSYGRVRYLWWLLRHYSSPSQLYRPSSIYPTSLSNLSAELPISRAHQLNPNGVLASRTKERNMRKKSGSSVSNDNDDFRSATPPPTIAYGYVVLFTS